MLLTLLRVLNLKSEEFPLDKKVQDKGNFKGEANICYIDKLGKNINASIIRKTK